MQVKKIREELKKPEYGFLQEHPNLGGNIILLALGGSVAYGTDVAGSDIDLRGIATNKWEDVLTMQDFGQVVDDGTDTTIYSLEKMVKLLCDCNPNVIELMGCGPEHYLALTEAGKVLLDNKDAFLSKRAIHTFGGYANAQLYRMNQLAARKMPQDELERHILRTLEGMQRTFPDKYSTYPGDSMKLYVDRSERGEMDTEIFMDVNLTHYPLRDYCLMWNELQNTVTQYRKIGRRNRNAAEHKKLSKHMMHLVRLYLMCFDILERGEIITYRAREHNWLTQIRNGLYLDGDGRPIPEFYEVVRELEVKMQALATHTQLPDVPDMERVKKIQTEINEAVICNKG